MSFLENRIPPPVIMLGSLVLMRMLAMFDQSSWLALKYNIFVALALLVLGVAISVSAVICFKNARTTINPLIPDNASRLVTSGIYKFSRNPMYLGMLCLIVAWAVYLSSAYSLSIAVVFILFITRFQIKPEENAMIRLFGDQFRHYARTTRRWL